MSEEWEMSYRIHRAMGWGMEWDKFIAFYSHGSEQDDNDIYEALEDRFDRAGDEGLTVPREVCSTTFKSREQAILEPRLLSKSFTDFGRKDPSEIGHGSDLYTIVANPDSFTDIIFYPNLNFKREWYRFNDGLDYAFEQWARDAADGSYESQSGPRDFTIYTAFGHYPFSNYLMDKDGVPREWEAHWELATSADWFPAVPSEIRWYLSKLDILSEEGINSLRPCVAQWWS